jgi:hypothetical protein
MMRPSSRGIEALSWDTEAGVSLTMEEMIEMVVSPVNRNHRRHGTPQNPNDCSSSIKTRPNGCRRAILRSEGQQNPLKLVTVDDRLHVSECTFVCAKDPDRSFDAGRGAFANPNHAITALTATMIPSVVLIPHSND